MKALGRLVFALVVGSLMSAGALGCNTFRGAGKDIQKGGESIENAAENAQTKQAAWLHSVRSLQPTDQEQQGEWVMRMYRLVRTEVVPAIGIWIVPFLLLGAATAAQSQATDEAGVQVLTRGPIHEAFAEASMSGITAGVVIAKSPPDPIAELPPDQRPEGGNVVWIPGYWSWDDDRGDFIWVSGVWRDLPPGRQWLPGYWTPAQGGSRWISGFWSDVTQTEVTYLPPPPEPLEAGPSSPAPAPDNIWTPGCWVWQQTRYDWQPGYWVVQQPDWVWSPAYYTWTPRGYVYVPGYWDHDILHRGVMFAPVYYERPVYARPDYYYSPGIVIDLAVILTSLFVQTRSHHYYYGDYYDHRYEERGFYPWYSKQVRRYGDDPIYAHYRSTQLRHDPDWDVHIDDQFRHRRDHVDARPAQTLALQVNIINNRGADATENIVIGRSLAEAAENKTLPLRLTPVNMDERRQIESRGREVRKLQSERAKIETAAVADKKLKGSRKAVQPVRINLPPSPVAARTTVGVTGVKVPPPVPAAPKLVAAKSRVRHVEPQNVELQTEPQRSQKKPERAESAVKAHPEKAKAQRVGSKTTKAEPKAQTHRSETKKQKGRREQVSASEDNHNNMKNDKK